MKLWMVSLSMCTMFAVLGVVGYLYLENTSALNVQATSTNTLSENKVELNETELMVSKIPTKKLEEQTVSFDELTANLQGKRSFVVLSLSAVTDSKKSAEEAKKREFQARNFLIKELAKATSEQMSDGAYVEELIGNLKHNMNQQMEKGIIFEIYVTKKLVQ